MRLLWFYLVFSLYFHKNISYPFPQPENVWKQSRYIIDNRRNLLFNKPFLTFYSNANPLKPNYSKSANITFEQNRKPFIEFQKDLSVEASVKNDYYNDYSSKTLLKANEENSLYNVKDTKQSENYTETGYNTQNLVHGEDIHKFNGPYPKSVIKEAHNENIDEQMLKWAPNQNENFYVTNAHARGPTIIGKSLGSPQEMENNFNNLNLRNSRFDYGESRNAFEFAPVALFTTTPSNYWDSSGNKTKSWIQIDKNVEPKEKHVYETRIETVSYHREVIFNSPQKKLENKHESYDSPETNFSEKEFEKMPQNNYEEEESNYEEEEKNYEEDEKNYEVDESVHVMTNGRFHGPTNREVKDNNNKFGFIVEGKNYRKYRVEERTPDGFIVGEYGVVSHDDGSLRGVRYTADSTTNPQLIYQALINFLSL